jgi:hypothetical protein
MAVKISESSIHGPFTCADDGYDSEGSLCDILHSFRDLLFNTRPYYGSRYIELESVRKQDGHGVENLHQLGRAATYIHILSSASSGMRHRQIVVVVVVVVVR